MDWRRFLTWKTLFYGVALPALRRLGPARCDAALGVLGRCASWTGPGRRAIIRPDRGDRALRRRLAANAARFLARDYPLEGVDDAAVFARFEVHGFEHVTAALDQGRGLILLGSHLGGYLAAVHWLYRRGVPLRLLVQRPRHVSRELHHQFARSEGPHPQSGFFLRRGMPPAEAAARLLRARAALRDGLAVYLSGDIPWDSPNSRPGTLLGQRRSFLAIWADLAALTGSPVVAVFCNHRPAGRFALRFEPLGPIENGTEAAAVARYLRLLDRAIALDPADAVAHLTWPCYAPTP